MKADESGPYQSRGLDRSGLKNPKVKAAMSQVPRHRFIPAGYRDEAYEDRAVSIGSGQTVSQPYIVALMTEQAGVTTGSKVLEIGTGSGYQAAVLAELGARVFTIEIIPELAESAKQVLTELGYDRSVTVRQGDGWEGWPEEAPFDAILVTASSPKLPAKLIAQLANHGRMIIPLERADDRGERLLMVERSGDDLVTKDLGGVRFVPLTGEARTEEPEPVSAPASATEDALGIGSADSNQNKTPLK